jgi:hypothetical protein
MDGWMDGRTDRWIDSRVFHLRSVSGENEHSGFKSKGPAEAPPKKHKLTMLSKMDLSILLHFSNVWRPHSSIQLHKWYFHENSYTGTRSPNVKRQLSWIRFYRPDRFNAVRYIATNNSLPRNNRFRFQGNVDKINRIWQSTGTNATKSRYCQRRQITNLSKHSCTDFIFSSSFHCRIHCSYGYYYHRVYYCY